MKKLKKVQKKGFTLIEVMVVVAIIVIMAGITFINVSDSIHKAHERQDREQSKFVTQVQSQAEYIRYSMLSGTPRLSTSS